MQCFGYITALLILHSFNMELLFSFPLILFIFLISLYLYTLLFQPKSKQTTKPGFRYYPLVGSFPDLFLNRHHFLEWTTDILSRCPSNTAFFHRLCNVHDVFTANPQNVEHMLKTNFQNYPKGTRFNAFLEDFLGKGIFNSDGELWRHQRKAASYEFNTKSLRNFIMENVRVELQTRLIPLLEHAAKANRVLDMQDVLERYAFDNICKLAFDVDPACLGGDGKAGAEFMQAFEDAATLSIQRFMEAIPALYQMKKFFRIGSEKKLRRSIAIVHEFANNIIKSRLEERAMKKDNEDLLSRFIREYQDSVEFLRDIVVSFILAGRDTTSSALTWFFWLLSTRPEIERKILQELKSIREKSGKTIGSDDTYGFDELREMHYLHAALSESMRLHPPVPVDVRVCLKDDILPDGNFIRKGHFITYHAYAMGRTESIWGKDCYEYKPERWLDNGICRQENPFKFPIFHAGPRTCLGKDMAYIQMKSIAACILERFETDLVLKDGKCPEYILSFTLKMKGGLLMKMKQRQARTRFN